MTDPITELKARQATECRLLEEEIRIGLAKIELRMEEVKLGLPKRRFMIDHPMRERELELLTYALRDLRSQAEVHREALQKQHEAELLATHGQIRQA